MPQAKLYSQLTDEVLDLGLPSEDYDAILELGAMIATSRPGVIVFTEDTPLPKWESRDGDPS